jgi:hypothetical protein
MPTAVKTTTAGFTIDEPSIFLIGGVSFETRGGVTVNPSITTRQIEVDGVTQALDGLDFVEGSACTVSTSLLALPDTTIATLMWQDTPSGVAPDLTWDIPDVQRLLPGTAYLSDIKVLRRRRGDGNWLGIAVPRALLTTWTPSAATNGDGLIQITIDSRAPIATPYARHWSFIRDDAPAGV